MDGERSDDSSSDYSSDSSSDSSNTWLLDPSACRRALVTESSLTLVLSWLGDGGWAYMAPVCSLWERVYRAIEPQTATDYRWAVENIDMLIYAREECEMPWDESACTAAARSGNLPSLQYLRAHGCEWNEDEVHSYAANGGHTSVSQWIHYHGIRWNESATAAAAGAGQLEALTFYVQRGCPVNASACENARLNGHTRVVDWLHTRVDRICSCPST